MSNNNALEHKEKRIGEDITYYPNHKYTYYICEL